MQHAHFNEDEWRLPETAVSKFAFAKDDKLIVMTGPIFTICDRFFSRGMGFSPVRIPSGFWKTMSYIDAGSNKLVTAAFIIFQDIDTLKTVKAKSRIQLRHFRVTTTELQLWTGLEFDHQMFDSNPLRFYSGPEVIKVNQFSELSTATQGLLAAGVANADAVREARSLMSLQQVYDLIDELSWY
nr:DNA/RNA non-specific endonuclease [Motilimonas pumila]